MPVCFWADIVNKVLLTGASGFIGSHIAELFSQKNILIRCLVRRTSNLSFLKQLRVEIEYGDITDAESVRTALKDVDFVIHTAGRASDWGSYQDFYENNVTGTINVVQACRDARIKDLIITGSISSYGEENSGTVKNEESPYNSHYPYFLDKIFPSAMNYYRDTKAILTQKACSIAAANYLNLTVLEPAWVYGEREFNTGFYAYVKAVRQGMRYAPGSRHNKFYLIYARDLAEAFLLAYRQKLSGVNRIIIGNPSAVALNEVYTLFCRAAELKPPRLLPKILTSPVGFGMELVAAVCSAKEPPILTRSRVNMMYDNIEFSAAKAKRLLGFEAGTPLREGIARTVAWYRQNGYL